MSLYNYIITKRNDSADLKQKMEETVHQLINRTTDPDHPGMLLGLIQSGKTRAFVGVIAKGLDINYDVCVVITKSSTALVKQTVNRIKDEFRDPVAYGYLHVYDIMNLPPLTNFILNKKIIFVAKKEDDNLLRLHNCFFSEYPVLGKKKVLIIDDEADFASVTYHAERSQPDGVKFGVLATQISNFRKALGSGSDFLQVTATPYSLYLQPEQIQVNSQGYEPLRPSFTVVLDAHPMYVGGKVYFEDSQDSAHYASHFFQAVSPNEFANLQVTRGARKPDERLRKNVLTTDQLEGIRKAFINFLVGGSIRSLQTNASANGEFVWGNMYMCAFLIHVHTAQNSHAWQTKVINTLIEKLDELRIKHPHDFNELVQISFLEFKSSIEKAGLDVPSMDAVIERVGSALSNGEISVKEVNSQNSVLNLLNEEGQLRLDNPFNVFIGGQVLDRGITIDHLIAFYYGRSPGQFQMDTVLQHSRMYGARDLSDQAVTRFYTSNRIYNSMRDMHYFDDALRTACLSGERVRFIQKASDGSIRPCSPNKVAISSLMTLKSHSRHLPIGFQTVSPTKLKKVTDFIDDWIDSRSNNQAESGWLEDINEVIAVLTKIESSFEYSAHHNNEEMKWDLEGAINALKYASQGSTDVWVFSRTNRNAGRMKNFNTSWGDAPDDGRNDLKPAKALAIDTPLLMLLKQNGSATKGWRDAPFYWPVILTPKNMQTSIYSAE